MSAHPRGEGMGFTGCPRVCWSRSCPRWGICVAARFVVPVSCGVSARPTGGLRSESDAHDQPAGDDDAVAAHWPQGAGSGAGVELACVAAPAARAADFLPGPERGLRDPDRPGLE